MTTESVFAFTLVVVDLFFRTMQKRQPIPKLVGGTTALLASFSNSRFLAIAFSHNLAAELGSPQMEMAYENGSFPSVERLNQADAIASQQLADFRKSLRKSVVISLVVALVVLIALGFFGKVGPSLPVDVGKLIAAIGAFSAGWASVLQLHPVQRTYRENCMHEIAHKTAVWGALLVGVVLGAVGALWW